MTASRLSKAPSAELFFLYDTHCPWSYVATSLVNEIHKAFPDITLHLWHTAFFDGKNDTSMNVKDNELKEVETLADIHFSAKYQEALKQNKNSVLSANLMTWAHNKTPNLVLELLNAIQKSHFEHGNPLSSQADFNEIIDALKLSPPAKVFKSDKLNKDTLVQLEEKMEL